LSVLAPPSAVAALEEIVFRETGTFGIRRHAASRHKLHRRSCTVQTAWGPVQGKLGWQNDGDSVFTPEYEACAQIAREQGVALREVYLAAQRAHAELGPDCEPIR